MGRRSGLHTQASRIQIALDVTRHGAAQEVNLRVLQLGAGRSETQLGLKTVQSQKRVIHGAGLQAPGDRKRPDPTPKRGVLRPRTGALRVACQREFQRTAVQPRALKTRGPDFQLRLMPSRQIVSQDHLNRCLIQADLGGKGLEFVQVDFQGGLELRGEPLRNQSFVSGIPGTNRDGIGSQALGFTLDLSPAQQELRRLDPLHTQIPIDLGGKHGVDRLGRLQLAPQSPDRSFARRHPIHLPLNVHGQLPRSLGERTHLSLQLQALKRAFIPDHLSGRKCELGRGGLG